MSYTDDELIAIANKSASEATPAEAAAISAYTKQFQYGVKFRARTDFKLSALRRSSSGGMTAYMSFDIPVHAGTILTCLGVGSLRFGDGALGMTWGDADGKSLGIDCELSFNDALTRTGVPRPGLLEIVE